MDLEWRIFSAPKGGNRPEEYEDACDHDRDWRRLAIADGASEGFECRRWSQALVRAFVRQPPKPDSQAMLAWLESPIEEWKSGIEWDRLPWYGAEKARRGAFATFLGLSLAPLEAVDGQDSHRARWQAIAVGDACLFQVRNDTLLAAMPLERAADFNNAPALLSTRPEYSRRIVAGLRLWDGELAAGDALVLATDALAAWFLAQIECGERPWQRLIGLSDETFLAFVQQLRQDAAMRNDDVTLVIGRTSVDEAGTPVPVVGPDHAVGG